MLSTKKPQPISWILPTKVKVQKSVYPPQGTTKDDIYLALVHLQQQLN